MARKLFKGELINVWSKTKKKKMEDVEGQKEKKQNLVHNVS